MSIAIVTDSTCDLPTNLASIMKIQVIPTILVIDDQSFEDGSEMTREVFYANLPALKTNPTTAAPAVGAFETVYRQLLQAGHEKVISLHISGKLSGVYNAAHAAAQAFNKQVVVVDSQQISMGLGYQALAAAEAAHSNAGLNAILDHVNQVRERTHLVAMLDTLEYVRRSGRISWGRATLGSMLSLKPFLEIREGLVVRCGEARTRRKGMVRLGEMLRGLGALARLAILHTNAEDDARTFIAALELPANIEPVVVNVTPVIGAHVGPHGLGFVAVTT